MRKLILSAAATLLVACSAPSGAQESEPQPQEEEQKETVLVQGEPVEPVEEARELLAKLREETAVQPLTVLGTLNAILEYEGVTPEEVGTTWIEIHEMEVRAQLDRARTCLHNLRIENRPMSNFRCLMNRLEFAGASPEAIGTNELELKILITCHTRRTCLEI